MGERDEDAEDKCRQWVRGKWSSTMGTSDPIFPAMTGAEAFPPLLAGVNRLGHGELTRARNVSGLALRTEQA